MKKLLLLITVLSLVFALTACKDDLYPPVESTAEESRVLMTFEIGKDKYEVRYELYRALFLNLSSEYDDGSSSFWDTSAADEAKTEIDERIKNMAAEIFSTIHHAKVIGYDVYSSEADARVTEMVSRGVNGYVDSENNFEGYNGDYDAYLAALREMNLNYSVQDLLYRYSIATEEINNYYAGVKDEDSFEPAKGAIEATDAEVRSFYYGDDSIRVLLITLDAKSYTPTRADEIRKKAASFGSESEVASYIVSFTATVPEDVFDGVLIGKYSLDNAFYSEVTRAAFALLEGETSEVIEINTGESSYYYILYRSTKNTEHYEKKSDYIRDVYIADTIGRLVSADKETLLESFEYTDLYKEIKHSEISMK